MPRLSHGCAPPAPSRWGRRILQNSRWPLRVTISSTGARTTPMTCRGHREGVAEAKPPSLQQGDLPWGWGTTQGVVSVCLLIAAGLLALSLPQGGYRELALLQGLAEP